MLIKTKHLKILIIGVIISAFCVFNFASAEVGELKKGIAHGTFMLQGYSYVGSPGTLRFFAAGAQAEESSLSYVDDAYISLDEGDHQGKPFELKGRFSGGPNGVVTFTSPEGMAFSVPLKDGRTFDLSIPGVQVHMTVTDPSIFDIDEEDMPAEYDPDAPLTDSGARAADISGQVEIACPPDFEAWDVLKMGRVIYNHCRLKTGEDSTLRISLIGGASFIMKPETEIIVNEARKEKSNFQLIFGGFWANVKKMAKGEEFGFKGSQAVAGIKGTIFVMEEKDGVSTLKVIEGTVNYTAKANNQSVDVSGGKIITATKDGLGEMGNFDIETENNYWNGLSEEKENPTPKTQTKTSGNYGTIGVGVIVIALAVVLALLKKKKNSI